MAIHTLVYRALLVMALLALVGGCTDPESNPVVPPPPLQSGDALDLNTTHVSANARPWLVNADWNIPAGRTVTVEPGARILFTGNYNVNVEGQLMAIGQSDVPITFSSGFLNQDLGQWGTIRLLNQNSGEQSHFAYCVFSYGAKFIDDTSSDAAKYYRGMLSVRNSSPVIENCLVIYNQNNAVYIHHDAGQAMPVPLVARNIITENDGAAVRTSRDVDLGALYYRITHNCVGGNSIVPFLLAQEDSTYGRPTTHNLNLDSTDIYFNLDREPELEDAPSGNYTPTSCSPAVDAGPDELRDPDGSRRDLGPYPYHQFGTELRGVVGGTLAANQTYRMSCHVRIPEGQTLVVPAGVRIEATGLYDLEVFGRLVIEGTWDNRVAICNCQVNDLDVWGGVRFANNGNEPSVLTHVDLQNYRRIDVEKPGVQFTGVKFDGGYLYGVNVATNTIEAADAVTFAHCRFDNCGSFGLHADSSAVVLRNSVVQNVKGRGINLLNSGESSVIYNTVVRACSTSAVTLENLTSPRIVNCVMTGNGYHGLHLINNCNPVVMNTIIWGNQRKGVFAVASSLPQLQFNNIAGNLERDIEPSTLGCQDCLFQDPRFVNAADGDFHLQAGSPSIDAGNPDPQYNDAVDGSRNDQGAFGGPLGGEGVGTAGARDRGQMAVQR